ncbi:MAG: MarR family winged helix-turn-helix transcriptional regulator [Candidatus Methanoplasma sp.]|jgi:DNA-binding MarR family transcriptional regulator|nr:MarR family winged helix-turn-helix transcriptional regulator [Candidatus Methanoplasma sp.]
MTGSSQITADAWKAAIAPIMRTVHKDLMSRHQAVLGEYGLTKMHAGYIMALSHGPDTLKGISEKLNLDKANTTRAVVFLREAGLVTDDRVSDTSRKYNIFLTEKGQDIAQALKKSMNDAFDTYTKGISQEEIDAIIAVLEKIRRNIDPKGKLLSTELPDKCDNCEF